MKKKQREYKIRGVVQDGGREIRKNGENEEGNSERFELLNFLWARH